MTTLERLMGLRERAGCRIEVYRYSEEARNTAAFMKACFDDLPLIAQEHEKEVADLNKRIERLQYLHEVVLGLTELKYDTDDANHSDFELYKQWEQEEQ